MRTKKQEELLNSFLSTLGDELGGVYREIADYLSELGYNPRKEHSSLSFKHTKHNKQIAKMGTRNDKIRSPFFALRFSACRGYSERFADVVRENIVKYPKKSANCIVDTCGWCAGKPGTHVYTYKFPDGETRSHCGAYALEIPFVARGDVDEIKKLINEEHEYLLKNEVGRVE